MELISQIIGDSPSGRAHKRLVEAGIASAVYAESLAMAEPGVALFGAQFAAGQDPARGAQELVQVIEGLGAEPVTDEEFKRAQTKWLKNWEQQYSNPETIGVVLSETVAQGDWRLLFLMRDRVQALTREAVQRVAQQRLVPSNRTLAHLRAHRAAAARAAARSGGRGRADEDLQAAGAAAARWRRSIRRRPTSMPRRSAWRWPTA